MHCVPLCVQLLSLTSTSVGFVHAGVGCIGFLVVWNALVCNDHSCSAPILAGRVGVSSWERSQTVLLIPEQNFR